jgi:hypothetical protein
MWLLDLITGRPSPQALVKRATACLSGIASSSDGHPLTRFECATEAIHCLDQLVARDALIAQDHTFRRLASEAFLLRADVLLREEEIAPVIRDFLAKPTHWGEPVTDDQRLRGHLRLAAEDLQRSVEQAPNECAQEWLILVHMLLGNLATARSIAEAVTRSRGLRTALDHIESVEMLLSQLSRRIAAVERQPVGRALGE